MLRYIFLVKVMAIVVLSTSGQKIPITTTVPTPHGDIPHTYYVPSSWHFYNRGDIGPVSLIYEFEIVLKNDSIIRAKTKIKLSRSKYEDHSVTIKNKKSKRTLFPDETKSISRTTLSGTKILGVPADSCWLFKTSSGRVNTYSFLADEGLMYTIAIQDGDAGPIVPLTEDNLAPIIYDNAKAMKHLEKGNLIKAVEVYNRSVNQNEQKDD